MDRRAYFRAYKQRPAYRAWEANFRAERRARGLCIQCAAISERFVRCLACRQAAQDARKRRRVQEHHELAVA